jgi:hypothetical protein
VRIVGIHRADGVAVAALSDDGAQVTGLAPLEQSWADAAGHLSREPGGQTLPAAGVGHARTPPRLLQPGDVVEVDRLGVLRTTAVEKGARHGR